MERRGITDENYDIYLGGDSYGGGSDKSGEDDESSFSDTSSSSHDSSDNDSAVKKKSIMIHRKSHKFDRSIDDYCQKNGLLLPSDDESEIKNDTKGDEDSTPSSREDEKQKNGMQSKYGEEKKTRCYCQKEARE